MWFYLPFIFFFQFLFALGLVSILSALSVFLRDLQQLVALGVTIWFFLTPIIYPITMIQSEEIRNIFLLNPMHSFVALYREIVLQGKITFIHLQIIIPVSLLTYFLGGWLFMKIKQALLALNDLVQPILRSLIDLEVFIQILHGYARHS